METTLEDRLRLCVGYNPETGLLFWKKIVSSKIRLGSAVGSRHSGGYIKFRFEGHHLLAHRVAFLLATGDWPCGEVDHINHRRDDNRWANLRDVPAYVNQANRAQADIDNKIGLLGVTKKGNRFRATMTRNGVAIHVGYFETAKEAHDAYLNARTERV